MNDDEDDVELSPREEAWAMWSEDPAIRHLITQLTQNPDVVGLDALLRSAFEAAWSAGFRYATE